MEKTDEKSEERGRKNGRTTSAAGDVKREFCEFYWHISTTIVYFIICPKSKPNRIGKKPAEGAVRINIYVYIDISLIGLYDSIERPQTPTIDKTIYSWLMNSLFCVICTYVCVAHLFGQLIGDLKLLGCTWACIFKGTPSLPVIASYINGFLLSMGQQIHLHIYYFHK